MEIGSQSLKGRWIHVAYTQSNKIGKFYINGVERMTNDDMPINSENWATAPTFNWIGRAAFAWDTYLINTLVYDIRFYNKVLTPNEIGHLTELTYDLDYEYMYGDEGDRSHLEELINTAEEFLSKDTSKYLQIAVTSYQQLLEYVKSVLKSEKISQPFIDHLCSQFDEYSQIVKSSENIDYDKFIISNGTYDTNRGFIHPGGIHTEEDFERVRVQISEGNEKVIQALNILKASEWSQSTTATWPVEVIIRGEGQQNYINAARGAHIAYQNALRWKLENDTQFAQHGVDVLMAWARVCKLVSGNSNWALAAGIYGYEFAQAAEILRSYEGWKKEDFDFFKDWMIRVWALPCYSFLSGRLGTWENLRYIPGSGHGTDGQRPGHYWSNWGLCNVLALQSIGLLCDDVFLYNQALSFYKYDQTTQANWNTENDLFNRGVMEYIDNLVPAVFDYEIESEAYGKVGQMQESGRDQGHATFSLGLAVDICLTAWNQGDDLFSYHDNRLAAGIEFVAGYNNANDDNLPFITYHYATCGAAWHNAQIHPGPSDSARGQTRAYWGKIIGHYEGIKGVTLPYADKAYEQMGIDGGCYGGASGAYDHFGFSVLMNTRSGTATKKEVPTLLTPEIDINGSIIDHNELGGLTNNFMFMKQKAYPRGVSIKLNPKLPTSAKDTGKWSWNTGQKTRSITVTTDKSFVYRVTYTNENNVNSYQAFFIAVDGDCLQSSTTPSSYVNDVWKDSSRPILCLLGDKVTLRVDGNGEWGSYVIWSNGKEGNDITFSAINDINITAKYVNHCGATSLHSFQVKIQDVSDHFYINDDISVYDKNYHIVNKGDKIVIRPIFSANSPKTLKWPDGSSGNSFTIDSIQTSTTISLQTNSVARSASQKKDYRFLIEGDKEYEMNEANYVIFDIQSGRVLTIREDDFVVFSDPITEGGKYHSSQIWKIQREKIEPTPSPEPEPAPETKSNTKTDNDGDLGFRYVFASFRGNKTIDKESKVVTDAESPSKFQIWNALGSDDLMIYDENKEFVWRIESNGNVKMNDSKELYDYPFKFVRYEHSSALDDNDGGNGKKKKNKAGMIAGIVIGLIAAVAIVVVVVIIVLRKKRNEASDSFILSK